MKDNPFKILFIAVFVIWLWSSVLIAIFAHEHGKINALEKRVQQLEQHQ